MKKLLAVLLAFAMIFSMAVFAFAEEGEESIPKPNEVIDNNVSARNALIALQNLYRVEEPVEFDEDGEPVDGGATMAFYPIDYEAAVLFRMCLQAKISGLTLPTGEGTDNATEIINIANKYSKYAEIILKWDKAMSDFYGYDCGFELSWNEAWVNYYGSKVAYLLPEDDPTTDDNEMVAAIPDAISFFVGEMGGDLLKGNIDKATATEVYGSIGYAVGELIAGFVGEDKLDPITVMKTVSGVIDTVGKVIPDQVEPADPVTSEAEAQKIVNMINEGKPASEITSTITNDIKSGAIDIEMIPDIAELVANSSQLDPEDETAKAIINFLKGLGSGEGGFELPDFGDINLPIDIGGSEGGSFLDTILGILGGLFGGGNGGNGGNGGWGNGGSNPDTGDVSFVAVAAIAAVAGAALVLTRKKSDDAE